MSFSAVVLNLCTAASCMAYNVDTAPNGVQCETQLKHHASAFTKAWNDTSSPLPLKAWLESQQIFEEPVTLERYSFKCASFEGDGLK